VPMADLLLQMVEAMRDSFKLDAAELWLNEGGLLRLTASEPKRELAPIPITPAEESIAVKTGRVEGVAMGESEGFGLRVLVDGAWGFASSDRLELAEADRIGALAVRIA